MNFYKKVYKIVTTIPKGKVMTYGQIANIISTPRAARVVRFAMRNILTKNNLPWQRVINSQGIISIVNPVATKKLQTYLLKKESVQVSFKQGNYHVNLKKYLYKYQ